jgi:hypothetical protein
MYTTPSLSASDPNGSAQVSVTVTVTPIVISLSGLDSSGNGLIGQYLTATVSASGFTCYVTDWNPPSNSYSGSVWGGGAPVLAVPQSQFYSPSSHYLVNYSGGTSTSTTFFVGAAGSPDQITVSLSIYQGDTDIGSASAQYSFGIMAPNHNLTLTCPGTTTVTSTRVSSNNGSVNAMTLTCWAMTPAEFSSEGTGIYCYTQLIGSDWVDNNGTQSSDPIFSLDNTFPYGFLLDINIPSDSTQTANTGPATQSASVDGPSFTDSRGITTYSVTTSFEGFVIYQAPSNGTTAEILPLCYKSWNWNCNSTNNAPPSTSANPQAGSLVDPASPTSFAWTHLASNNG